MINFAINYNIEFSTPVYVGTGTGISSFLDRECLKDSYGNFYIPGSLIKGALKNSSKKLLTTSLLNPRNKICQTGENPRVCITNNTCMICKIYGSPFKPANIFFSGAVNKSPREFLDEGSFLRNTHQFSVRTSVRINRRTRTAESGHLFNTEVAENIFSYAGSISGCIEPTYFEDETKSLEIFLLLVSMKSIFALGGSKSRGLGQCKFTDFQITINDQRALLIDIINKDQLAASELILKEK